MVKGQGGYATMEQRCRCSRSDPRETKDDRAVTVEVATMEIVAAIFIYLFFQIHS